MKTVTSLTAVVLIGSILCGCSGKRIDVTTLTYGTSTKEEVVEMFDTGGREFEFRLLEKNYSFLIYFAPSSSDQVGFLFEEGKLVAANKSNEGWSDVGYENCIVFPLTYEDNIRACFLNTTNDFIAARHPLKTLKFVPYETDASEIFEGAAEFATYAALSVYLIPTFAVIVAAAVPVALVDGWQCAATQDELAAEFQLGEPMKKYEKLLEEHPGHIISKNSRSSSVLIPGGVFLKQPVYSIGVYDGKIIWLEEQPPLICDSCFSIKGCKLGNPGRATSHIEYGNKNGPLKDTAGQALFTAPEDQGQDDFWSANEVIRQPDDPKWF